MTQAIAYLGFDGNCADAMRFYEKATGGKLELMMSGADSPMCNDMPPEFRHRILHARLVLPGGGKLYGGDAPSAGIVTGTVAITSTRKKGMSGSKSAPRKRTAATSTTASTASILTRYRTTVKRSCSR